MKITAVEAICLAIPMKPLDPPSAWTGSTRKQIVVRVRTASGYRRAIVSTGPGNWAGTGRLLDRAEHQVSCPHLSHRVDYGRDRVRVRIPRHCLGDPDWVRLAISAFLFRPMSALSDNPHNTGPQPNATCRIPRHISSVVPSPHTTYRSS